MLSSDIFGFLPLNEDILGQLPVYFCRYHGCVGKSEYAVFVDGTIEGCLPPLYSPVSQVCLPRAITVQFQYRKGVLIQCKLCPVHPKILNKRINQERNSG